MTAEHELRGSPVLAVLDKILHDGSFPWETLELAGRGISARARCTISILERKTRDMGPLPDDWLTEKLAAADKLIELADLEDELVDLWQRRRTDQMPSDEFEAELLDIVQRLEAWPAHLA